METIEEALRYCRDTVRRGDRDRFLTTLFAPAVRRDDLLALAAFNLELARVREQVSEPMIGLIRLQWWRETLDGLFGVGPVRRHPVATALAATIQAHSLTREAFDRLLTAREADMEDAPNADMAALENYARESTAPLLVLWLRVLAPEAAAGAGAVEISDALHAAGSGYALAGLLRAVPFHAAAGRMMLPRDRIEGAGLAVQDLARPGSLPARAAILRDVADLSRDRLGRAGTTLRGLPRRAAPIKLSIGLARWHLERLAAADFDPHAPSVTTTPPWAIWRLARQHYLGGW